MLINPKEIEIEFEGETFKFNIGKFPTTAGREIISKYPVANMPKIGDYAVSEETMLKLMSYVERVYDDRVQPLTSRTLIDNHIPSWEVLVKLEGLTIEYNCSFFRNGKAYDFWKKLSALAEPKIIEILTALLGNSSQAAKPRSKNSKRPTR